jgi:hypothetical protein
LATSAERPVSLASSAFLLECHSPHEPTKPASSTKITSALLATTDMRFCWWSATVSKV